MLLHHATGHDPLPLPQIPEEPGRGAPRQGCAACRSSRKCIAFRRAWVAPRRGHGRRQALAVAVASRRINGGAADTISGVGRRGFHVFYAAGSQARDLRPALKTARRPARARSRLHQCAAGGNARPGHRRGARARALQQSMEGLMLADVQAHFSGSSRRAMPSSSCPPMPASAIMSSSAAVAYQKPSMAKPARTRAEPTGQRSRRWRRAARRPADPPRPWLAAGAH